MVPESSTNSSNLFSLIFQGSTGFFAHSGDRLAHLPGRVVGIFNSVPVRKEGLCVILEGLQSEN